MKERSRDSVIYERYKLNDQAMANTIFCKVADLFAE